NDATGGTEPEPSARPEIPDHEKPAILREANLMQLLADTITFKSSLSDINIVLRCGAKVNTPVKRGLRPLHYAVYVDYVECVKLLIERGADVNATDDIGYTPIHLCARKGNIESMKILIEHGATVDFFTHEEDVDENSRALGYLTIEPLNLAIENNHVDCLRLLLDSGARPDHKYFMGYEINLVPLEHLECGISPLMKACRQQNLPAARKLLAYGAKVDIQGPTRFEQKTALHYAIASGNGAILHVLLRHGASPRRPPEYKYAAMHAAVLSDRPDFCEMLLKWGAQIDENSDEGATPLMLAAATRELSRQQELVQVLLEKGANPNASAPFVTYTSPYLSPLSEYLRNMDTGARYDVVNLLLKYGAKVHFRVSTTSTRLMDPHGVLSYLSGVKDKDDVMDLLCTAATHFDSAAIATCRGLTSVQKGLLLSLASAPRDLKHLVRMAIRDWLSSQRLPEAVDALPLPAIMKNYLLMQ
ncbi:hypothetical protein BaRGS_00003671, partial [Batillaria attramentaria]